MFFTLFLVLTLRQYLGEKRGQSQNNTTSTTMRLQERDRRSNAFGISFLEHICKSILYILFFYPSFTYDIPICAEIHWKTPDINVSKEWIRNC